MGRPTVIGGRALRGLAPAVAVLTLAVACTRPGPTDPALDGLVRFQVVAAADPSLLAILAEVRQANFAFLRDEVSTDTTVWVQTVEGAIVARAALLPPPGSEPLRVRARLGSSGEWLFEGETWVQGTPAETEVLVRPLPARVTFSDAVGLDHVGATTRVTATVRLANDAPWEEARIDWSSEDPTVAEVSGDGVVTARGNGFTRVVATSGEARGSLPVTVEQVPAFISGVHPQDTTVALGETFQMLAFGQDVGGFPLLPGAGTAWSATGPVSVSRSGVVTAEAEGVGLVSVTLGSAVWTATVQVVQGGAP